MALAMGWGEWVRYDAVADPLKDGMNPRGPFAGVPYLMKDLGPTLKGRLQEMGSLLMRGHLAEADSFLTMQMRNFVYTPLTNLCGIPGISLPLGIHAQARQANDGLLLQLASQIECAIGGRWNAGRRAAVHVCA